MHISKLIQTKKKTESIIGVWESEPYPVSPYIDDYNLHTFLYLFSDNTYQMQIFLLKGEYAYFPRDVFSGTYTVNNNTLILTDSVDYKYDIYISGNKLLVGSSSSDYLKSITYNKLELPSISKESLIGTWNNNSIYMIFNEDNTLKANTNGGDGTYKIDNNMLLISPTNENYRMSVLTATVKDGILTIGVPKNKYGGYVGTYIKQ